MHVLTIAVQTPAAETVEVTEDTWTAALSRWAHHPCSADLVSKACPSHPGKKMQRAAYRWRTGYPLRTSALRGCWSTGSAGKPGGARCCMTFCGLTRSAMSSRRCHPADAAVPEPGPTVGMVEAAASDNASQSTKAKGQVPDGGQVGRLVGIWLQLHAAVLTRGLWIAQYPSNSATTPMSSSYPACHGVYGCCRHFIRMRQRASSKRRCPLCPRPGTRVHGIPARTLPEGEDTPVLLHAA